MIEQGEEIARFFVVNNSTDLIDGKENNMDEGAAIRSDKDGEGPLLSSLRRKRLEGVGGL